jgi:hypothetical protein
MAKNMNLKKDRTREKSYEVVEKGANGRNNGKFLYIF